VATSPAGQSCTVSGGTGTITTASVTGITITCTDNTATAASDDFGRADGSLGPNWTDLIYGGLAISSQAAVGTNGSGLTGDAWTADVFGSDQYSQIELTSAQLTGGQWIAAAVRIQNGGQDGYAGLYFWNNGSPELMLFRRTAGNWAQLGASVPTGPLAAGTELEVQAAGSAISLLENGTDVISVSDSSVSGGAPGIMAFGTAQAGDWSGGDAGGGGSGSGATYTVGGTVSGLTGTVTLQDNGGDTLDVTSNGPFAFATPLASGAAYDATVATSPAGQSCTVSGGTGTITTASVTGITITCTDNTATTFSVSYESTDASGIQTYGLTSPDNGPGSQTLRVLQPTDPAPGVPHNFLYVLPVEPGLGSEFGDGLETMLGLNAQNQYNLTIIEPTFSLNPWYANNPVDASVQYENFMTQELVPWVEQNLSTSGTEQNWLIGFSKSGYGGQDLILKHPDIFSLAASWDFPADMSSYDQYCCDSAANYGTEANFEAKYELTPAFVDAHKAPFLTSNRIWIGGYEAFQTDDSDYDALLTSEGILHTAESEPMPHNWNGGWVPLALAGLYQDSLALNPSPSN
jgi:hypothetical protein